MDEDRFRAALRAFESGQATRHVSVESVVARGRRAARRRRTQRLIVAAAACLALFVGAPLAQQLTKRGDNHAPNIAVNSSYYSEGAFAVDNVAYVGGKRVRVPGSIQSLRYSAAGVVIMWGESPDTDNASSEHYTLVTPRGAMSRIPVITKDQVVGVDATSPYFSYLLPFDGSHDRWNVIVFDLRSLKEVSRVVVQGNKSSDGFTAPLIAVGKDVVWVQFDKGVTQVEWRTGKTRRVSGSLSSGEVESGRDGITSRDGSYDVTNLRTGGVVGRVSALHLKRGPLGSHGRLSPHGRFVFFMAPQIPPGESSRRSLIAGLAGDQPLPLKGRVVDAGWTPSDGVQVLRPNGRVEICDAQTAACTDTGIRYNLSNNSVVKMGGNQYQS